MQNELLGKYLDSILEVNHSINLTRITDRKQAEILHIEDSLVALDEINAAPEGLYGDLGTGGGFPGVPIAIYTGRETVLIDSVKKKVNVLSTILSELELDNQISVYGGRIEDLTKIKKNCFSVLTARALSQLSSLLELASPLLRKHGHLVCYKAKLSDEELEHALSIQGLVGMKLISRRAVILSDGMTYREILTFEKSSSPKIKLPRRVGLAQNDPLKPRTKPASTKLYAR